MSSVCVRIYIFNFSFSFSSSFSLGHMCVSEWMCLCLCSSNFSSPLAHNFLIWICVRVCVCECAQYILPTKIFNGNRIRNLLKSATFATSLYFWTEIRFCPVYNFISSKFHQNERKNEKISLWFSRLSVCVFVYSYPISDSSFNHMLISYTIVVVVVAAMRYLSLYGTSLYCRRFSAQRQAKHE